MGNERIQRQSSHPSGGGLSGKAAVSKPPQASCLIRILSCLMILSVLFWLLHRAVNPIHINKIIMINMSDEEVKVEAPVAATLSGEVDWSQILDSPGGLISPSHVSVTEIQRAWFGGILKIHDVNGKVLSEFEIRPPGRYCGVLVIVKTPTGESIHDWNRMPRLTPWEMTEINSSPILP